MEITEIIRRGIVTEKSVDLQTPDMNQQRRVAKGKMEAEKQTHAYTFEVAVTANKVMIRQAINALFPDVTVLRINTMRMPGKARSMRTRKGVRYSTPREWKKAIVTVRANEIIAALQP